MKTLLLFSSTLWKLFYTPWRLRAAFVLLLWGGLTAVALAQTKVWDKATYDYEESGKIAAMVAAPDGGYVMGLNTETSEENHLFSSYFLLKRDAAGKVHWANHYESGKSSFDVLTSLIATSDGGYLAGGAARPTIIVSKPDQKDTDYWLVKTNPNGVKVWDKSFGSSGNDMVTSVTATPDGGYLIGGTSDSGIGGDKTEPNQGGSDFWIIKTDENGNKLWDKTFGTAFNDKLSAVMPTADGSYLVGGTTFYPENKINKSAYWVLKISANGEELWNKTFDAIGSGIDNFGTDILKTLVAAPDGGYLLGGTSEESVVNGDKTDYSNGSDDFWIIKIDENGNRVWDKVFGGSRYDVLQAIVSLPDGGYLLGGYSDSPRSGNVGDVTEPSRGLEDYWIVKIRENGTKVWDKRYGGEGSDKLISMAATNDGSFILAGLSNSQPSGDKSEGGGQDVWEIKILIRQPQTIAFDSIPDKILGEAPFVLKARASSGLPVHFQVQGPATITDSLLTITGEGVVTIYASQPGNDRYEATEKNVVRSFIVREASPFVQIEWDKAYSYGEEDGLSEMAIAPDGGYLLAGTTYSPSGMQTHASYMVIRIDASGKQVWAKEYSNKGYDLLSSITATADGNYLLGGSTAPSTLKGEDEPVESDFWLIKIDGDGNKLWDKTYGGTGNELLGAILTTPDGGFLIGGTSSSGISGDKTQASNGLTDLWIIKADAVGNKVWDKAYGGSGTDGLSALLSAPDGSFLLAGNSGSGINGDKTQTSQGGTDYWIVKIDANGDKLRDKAFGGSQDEDLVTILATPDGGYLLGGTSKSGISGDKTQASQGKSDYWIVKIDKDWNKVWDKTFGASEDDQLADVIATADGGYLLGGSSDSGADGDKTQSSRGFWDYWIVKTDASGNKVWDKRFGGDDYDDLSNMLLTPDGSYLLGGSSYSGVGGDKTETKAPDFWIIKIKDISAPPTPAPILSKVSPRAALPGDTITILGAHLLGTTAIHFSGTAASFTVSSDSVVTAVVPLSAASGKIEVETATGKIASTDNFLVLQPSIVAFAPSRGYAGAPVLLYGRHLATTSEVRFNGVPAQNVTIYNDFFILARVPEGATSGKISLTLKGGAEATSNWTYRVLQRTAAQVIAATEAANAVAAQQTEPYPNPFTGSVTIPVLLEQPSPVRLLVYTAAGQQVSEMTFGALQAGAHLLQWNGTNSQGRLVKPGLYTYQLITNNTQTSGKLLKTEAR